MPIPNTQELRWFLIDIEECTRPRRKPRTIACSNPSLWNLCPNEAFVNRGHNIGVITDIWVITDGRDRARPHFLSQYLRIPWRMSGMSDLVPQRRSNAGCGVKPGPAIVPWDDSHRPRTSVDIYHKERYGCAPENSVIELSVFWKSKLSIGRFLKGRQVEIQIRPTITAAFLPAASSRRVTTKARHG
jgi:hypothetical protein